MQRHADMRSRAHELSDVTFWFSKVLEVRLAPIVRIIFFSLGLYGIPRIFHWESKESNLRSRKSRRKEFRKKWRCDILILGSSIVRIIIIVSFSGAMDETVPLDEE